MAATVYHPDPSGAGGQPRHAHFAAHGMADGVIEVIGVLINSKQEVYGGQTILQPAHPSSHFWIILFPMADVPKVDKETYTFYLLGRAHGTQPYMPLTNVPGIKVPAPTYGFGLTYPTSSITIHKQFAAYGTQGELSLTDATFDLGTFTFLQNVNNAQGWVLGCTTDTISGNTATLTVSKPGAVPPPTPQKATTLTVIA